MVRSPVDGPDVIGRGCATSFVVDDPGENAVGPALDCGRRNREDVAAHLEREPRIDEVTRPQLSSSLGNIALSRMVALA